MEEEEETYGFGSFSDLFEAGPKTTAKRLDVGALSRFCMSERLLARFQQQQQPRDRRRVFQHVAARFDGVGIEGGLGTLALSDLEGSGVVWMQTTQSDSDALERRKKELQDITNRQDGAKSAAALFIALQQVAKVHPTTVQNTVQGVKMTLLDGNRLELTFMPGPFAVATHRDDFLKALKEQMDAAADGDEINSTAIVRTPGSLCEAKTRGNAVSNLPIERNSRKSSNSMQKEEFRQLVRKYTTLDQLSDEGLEIAKQVHAGTGYHLGPMTKQTPKFSADSEYRKETVEKLTEFLKQMNQDWSEADSDRQLHTKAKHSRNDDDLYEYTDTDTGAQIPTRAYEQRYLEYVKAHDVNPVLHLFPVRENSTKLEESAQNGSATLAEGSTESVESVTKLSSYLTTTIGVDISSSCIVAEDFLTSGDPPAIAGASKYRAEDTVFRAAVDNARMKLLNNLSSAFSRVSENCDNEAESRHGHSKNYAQAMAGVEGRSSTRKRARERRRSLVLATANDLLTTAETTESKISQEANETLCHQSHRKRSRSASLMSETAQKARRKARRQSIVNTVDLSVTMSGEDKVEEKKPLAKKRRIPERTHKSPRPKHSYARETSALEMVDEEGDEVSDVCQLCYSERALVHMNPCDHVVCASCWSRLSPSSGEKMHRVCPWDREPVTKR